MNEWKTIDSVPMDGSLVLITDGKDMETARNYGDGWLASDGADFGYGNWDNDLTHWMPLPKPPIQASEGAAKYKEEQKESIWKPASELPDIASEEIYVRYNYSVMAEFRGKIKYVKSDFNLDCGNWGAIEKCYIKDWCTLTDFVNQQEEILTRLQKLEQLNK